MSKKGTSIVLHNGAHPLRNLLNATKTSIVINSTLINNLRIKDSNLLLQVYDKYAGVLYSYIYKIIGDKRLSEEVLEKTFERVLIELDRFNEKKDDAFIWMLNISRNEAIETLIYIRSKQVSLTSQMGCMRSMPIKKFISLLEPAEKTIFSLMYYRQFTCEQVSELLKIRVELVKLKVNSAYGKLQKLYPQQQPVETKQVFANQDVAKRV